MCEALEASHAFESLWLSDHLLHLGPEGQRAPRPEAMMLLAALVAPTSFLRLGLLVASATFRHPALMVKMVTTLDVLSSGRAVLGIGAGHPRTELEHRIYGIPFPPLGERMDRLEDALRMVRAMLGGDGPPNFPSPAGRLPVMVGGSGEQRLLRLVARYADMCNFSASAGDSLGTIPHKLDVLQRHCAVVGRDRRDITITYKSVMEVAPTEAAARQAWDAYRMPRGLPAGAAAFIGTSDQVAEQISGFLKAGIDEVIVELPGANDPDAVRKAGGVLQMAAQRAGDDSPLEVQYVDPTSRKAF